MAGSRAPGVLISFVDPPPAVEPTRIDVPGLVCVTERGPVNTPVRCASWTAFGSVFGTFVPNGLGAYAAKGFFDNGGGPAWVVRVAAPERRTTTVGTQPLDRTRSVLAGLDGLVVGAVATLRQGTVGHAHLVTAVDPVGLAVTWDRPLHPDFDTSVSIDVATGAGVATVVLAAADGSDAVRVDASSPGSWGEQLEVAVSAGSPAATTNRLDQPGAASVTPLAATSGLRVGETCRISQATGAAVAVAEAIVAAVDHARRVVTWTAPLPAAIDLTRTFSVEARTFGLVVLRSGAVVETWPDLSVVPSHPRFAVRVLAGSAYVSLEVLAAAQPAPARVRLFGGRDGTAALATADLVGDELLDDRIGLAALRDVDEPAVIVIPDLVAAPTPARVLDPRPAPDPCDPCAVGESVPDRLEAVLAEAGAGFDVESVVAAQQAVVESCERNSERVALLDPPSGFRTLADLRGWAVRFSSSYAVIVAPWLRVIQPDLVAAVRAVPASGHLAGLIAARDAEAGPWLSPANRTLAWAHGLTQRLTDAEHAVANDDSINLIRPLPGRGLVPMGARTLSPDALWLFVAVRRTMIWLRRLLRHYLAWVVFEPNSTPLAGVLTEALSTLLTGVWEAGGLAGDSPDQAFALAVDQSRAAVGDLLIVVGVALARPGEFVTVRVSRTGNRLEITEEPVTVPAGGLS